MEERMTKHNYRMKAIAPIVYILLAGLYFLPVDLPLKTAYPVFALFVMSFGICPWQVTAALLLSAAGDAFPSSTQLIPKILCFAAAHVFYIYWFLSQVIRRGKPERRFSIPVIGIFCCVLTFALLAIAPHAPTAEVKVFSISYAALLITMACSAVHTRNKALASGAILFLVSDILLGWGIFVSRIPYGHYLVMIPYYAGQLLIFLGSRSNPVQPDL